MAVIAETFHPVVNGVSNSVVRVLEHLGRGGHQALVIAPGPGPDSHAGAQVVRVPSFRPPMYRSLPVALPRTRLADVLAAFEPDVVHLASPALLGYAGARAAAELGIPAVAVFQTDLAGYLSRYHLRVARPYVWRYLRKLHGLCALTLVPSTSTAWELAQNGIGPVARWARGVDLDGFHPRWRSVTLRRVLAPHSELIVGYVGRLAPEKRVHLLAPLTQLPDTRLVIVGDGPSRTSLQRRMPKAIFLGFRDGSVLAETYASLDVFVHPGANETFCQSVQEALASGVPVIAPPHGGPLDLVQHGDNGWLWTGNDSGLLCEQVISLADDADLRGTMRLRARASVLGRTWQQVGHELLGHYRSVLPATTAASPSERVA